MQALVSASADPRCGQGLGLAPCGDSGPWHLVLHTVELAGAGVPAGAEPVPSLRGPISRSRGSWRFSPPCPWRGMKGHPASPAPTQQPAGRGLGAGSSCPLVSVPNAAGQLGPSATLPLHDTAESETRVGSCWLGEHPLLLPYENTLGGEGGEIRVARHTPACVQQRPLGAVASWRPLTSHRGLCVELR